MRDAIIVMLDAPHLFLPVLDGYWYGLGQASDEPGEVVVPDGAPLSPETQAQTSTAEDDSIRSVLREILLENGPLRFVDLRARAVKRLGRKSISSVGPILLTSGEFMRPLPGIYAVAEQMPSLSFVAYEPPAFLLSVEQARWFALARYAGEPYGRYPLWVPEAEYALCRWAQTNVDPISYQSLLSVASIDDWPVSESERAHWSGLKAKDGRYCLSVPPRIPPSSLVPPLDRVLAACVLAEHDGGLSWITGNRILKRRLDSHISPGLLATLLAMDCLAPVADWQKHHPATARLPQKIERLSREMQVKGSLEWESPFGQRLIKDMNTSASSRGSSWLDRRSASDLLAALGSGRAATLTPDDADESLSAFEELLREANRIHEAEQVQDALRSITQR